MRICSPSLLLGLLFAGSFASAQAGVFRIQITPANVPVAAGNSRYFNAVEGFFSSMNRTGGRNIPTSFIWSSSDSTIANVDLATGAATGMAPGLVHIMARSGPFVGYTTLIVGLSTVQITPGSTQLGVGKSLPYTATGTLTNGSTVDVTGISTWNSSDPSIVSINQNGVAFALKSGSVTITASFGGIAGTTSLTTQ